MIMGKIRLAPGKPGFFDDLTGIHLSILNPEASVFRGMNTTNLKRGVSYGSIRLVYGTLDENSIDKPISTPIENVVEIEPVPTVEVQKEPEVKEETVPEIKKEPVEVKPKEEIEESKEKTKTDSKKKNTSKAAKKEEKAELVEE